MDLIFSQAVTFWSSMEFVVDVLLRRKEHSEVLLRTSQSARMIAKATASLADYAAFWQAFALLCGRYAEALQPHAHPQPLPGAPPSPGAAAQQQAERAPSEAGMYAWLSASDEELASEEAGAIVHFAPIGQAVLYNGG